MKDSSLRGAVDSLEALLAAETDDIDSALLKMASLQDPVSVRRRLALLLRAGRLEEAHSEITTRSPDPEWLELGIQVALHTGHVDLAGELEASSAKFDDETGTLRLRAALAYGDAAVLVHLRKQEQAKQSAFAIPPGTKPMLDLAKDNVESHCHNLISRMGALSQLEKEILTVYVLVKGLLGDSADAKDPMKRLIGTGDVYFQVGRFVLEGRLPLVSGLAEAINTSSEHHSLLAQLTKALLMQEERPDLPRTFGRILELVSDAEEPGTRGALFSALYDLALSGGQAFVRKVQSVKPNLLDGSIADHRARLALALLAEGNSEGAIDALGDDSDEPLWLKACSQYQLAIGQEERGIELSVEAGMRCLDDRWLEEAAALAFQAQEFAMSVRCLSAVREYYPWHTIPRLNLARLLWKEGQQEEALAEISVVAERLPDDITVKIDKARWLIELDQPDHALVVLDEAIALNENELAAIRLKAVVLRRLGKVTEAFDVLNKSRQKFWTKQEFLLQYMNFAYAAGEEDAASRALSALVELKRKGEIDSSVMREASLDEVIEYQKSINEQTKKLNEQIIRGRMPWIVASQINHNPIIVEWSNRTRSVPWVAEAQDPVASLTVYATNGYTVGETPDGRRLTEIQAYDGEAICLDYSALLTLHQLGLLHALSKTYNTVFIPGVYREQITEDVFRLQPHQLSTQQTLEVVRKAVDDHQIGVVECQDVKDSIATVSEYETSENSTALPLSSLADLLESLGRLGNDELTKLREVCQRAGSDIDLSPRAQVVIELSTLQTLVSLGALESVVGTLRVHITQEDWREVVNTLANFNRREALRRTYSSLWSTVSSLPNIQLKNHSSASVGESFPDGDEVGLAALKLSETRQLPLLVDDRVLQALLLNRRNTTSAAFGSDVVLRKFLASGQIDKQTYVRSVLQLVEWRYKFLVLDAEVLSDLARKYSGRAPGRDLATVACYVQSCMCDPGLFGGLENSDPPSSMAIRLYMSWMIRVGEFLALVWLDDEIHDDRALALTQWAAMTLLPQVPTVLPLDQQIRVAQLLKEAPLTYALLKAGEQMPNQRIAQCFELFAERLSVPRSRFEALVAEIANRAA